MKKNNSKFTRRALLGGLGVGAAAPFVPLLTDDAMAQTGLPQRVCFMMTPNGIHPDVVAQGDGSNFTLNSVLGAFEERHKEQLVMLGGIEQKTYTQNPIPNDHPPTVPQFMTGHFSRDPQDGGDPATNNNWTSTGPSVDHVLSERLQANDSTRTRRGIVRTGVDAGNFAGKWTFTGAGEWAQANNNPSQVFEALFGLGFVPPTTGGGTPTGPDPAVLKRINERKSVIDNAKAELEAIINRVGVDDRRKIEAHLEHLRAVELTLSVDPTTPPPASGAECTPPGVPAGGHNVRQEAGYQAVGEQMMDLITQGFACDQIRVATIQWGNGASNQTYPSKGVNLSHHEITHDNYAGNENNRRLVSEWYGERFFYLVDAMSRIPEGDGTMLDNTLIVWNSEHSGSSQHGRRDMPFTLAGSLGGTIRTNQVLRFGNNKPHNDVYGSIAAALGFSDLERFGEQSVATGVLGGLLV